MTLGQILHRLTASSEELDAADERRSSAAAGATAIADLVPRRRATVAGVVGALTYRPREKTAALVVQLFDGSGVVDLVFLGRHDVPGIEPGRRMVASGMVVAGRARHVIYDPAYELLPRGSSA
ncbi:MAG: OB-fold nucleic acid binding domain-containing protein [Georgenia sp.]